MHYSHVDVFCRASNFQKNPLLSMIKILNLEIAVFALN